MSEGANAMIGMIKANWGVEDQYKIAEALAANCGYKLTKEDDEESLEIKKIIELYELNCNGRTNQLIIKGLKALLK